MAKENDTLEQEQRRKLSELGGYLKQVREEQQLTLEQVATKTLIRPAVLDAIETGALHRLPEPVYIQGFIKRYAEVLELDGSRFSNSFPIRLEIRSTTPLWKMSAAAQLRPIHLYTMYVVLIMMAISGLSYLMDRSSPWSSGNIVTSPPTIPQSSADTGSNANDSQTPSTAISNGLSAVSGKAVQVEMTLTAQSWIRIEVDGKTEFQGIMPEGTQKVLTAETQLTIRAGNAGAVMLAYNNEKAQPMGAPGAVEEKTFSTEQRAARLPSTSSDSVLR